MATDEREIGQLEMQVAVIFGWRNVTPYTDGSGWFGQHPEGHRNASIICPLPRFARDASAILSALEWLLRQQGSVTESEGMFHATEPYREDWFSEESLGVAICRAIVSLGGVIAASSSGGEE